MIGAVCRLRRWIEGGRLVRDSARHSVRLAARHSARYSAPFSARHCALLVLPWFASLAIPMGSGDLFGLSFAQGSPPAGESHPPTLLFLTDFGVRDDAVAICKGVMLAIVPEVRIVDLTHDVTPFDVREGAFYLAQTAPYYPAGTVFVGVVDPGVGTERRAIVLQTERGQLFVGPDNGVLSLVAMEEGVAGIWEVTNPEFMLAAPSATFHGRDIFSPCGAWLANGRAPSEVGPRIEQMVSLDIEPPRREPDRLTGEVMMLDKAYGNVWTNLSRSLVEELVQSAGASTGSDSADGSHAADGTHAADATHAAVLLELELSPSSAGEDVSGTRLVVPLVHTFGDVSEGADLAYFNSRDQLSFAVNMGSFASVHGVQPGSRVVIRVAR